MSAYNRNIYLFYAFSFFKELFFVSAVLVVFFTDWGGIPLVKVQILQAWFVAWIFILEVPTGLVADYIGRKQSLILGALIFAFGVLIFSFSPNFHLFLLAEMLLAAGMALVSGADEAFIYDSLKRSQTKHLDRIAKNLFAHIQIIKMISIAIAAIAGGFIASRFGLVAAMRFSAIPITFAAVIGLFFVEPHTANKQETLRYVRIFKNGFKSFINNKALQIVTFDTVIISAFAYFVIWLYQPKLKNIGVAIALFGFFHAFLPIAQIVFLKLMPKIENKFNHTKTLLTISSLLIGLSFLVAGIFNHVWVVIALFIFGGGLGLTRRTFMASFLNKNIPSGQRATVLSFVSMLRRFLLIGLNPLVGYMADWSLNYTLISLGVTTLLVAIFSPIKQEMFE